MINIKKNHTASLNTVASGKILSRYVKKSALFAMLFAVIGLWALQMIFAYLAELEDFSDTYTYLDALKYIFYKSPYFLEQFTPTGALLGAVIGLGLLANNSELIVMRAAGLSTYRIVSWVLQPAFIFVMLALAINQYILPHSNLLANKIRKPDTVLLASVNGYWTLQEAPQQGSSDGGDSTKTGHNILYIDYADANGDIGEVKRWHLDKNNNLRAVSQAAGGTYIPQSSENTINISQDMVNHEWKLNDITTLTLAERSEITNQQTSDEIESSASLTSQGSVDDANAKNADRLNNAEVSNEGSGTDENSDNSSQPKHTQSSQFILDDEPLVAKSNSSQDNMTLPISPSSVYLLTRRAEDLSLTQLYDHKRFNASQGTRSLEHEVAFWQKLLSPFAILSLVIVACSFVFGSLRTHSLGLRIVVALIFGLLFSYFQDLTGYVSLATGASPLLMVLLPILGSTALGLYLLKRQG